MSSAAGRVRTSPRGVLAMMLALAVVVVPALAVATAARATTAATEDGEPTELEPTEQTPPEVEPAPDAACEITLQRGAQLVVCVMGGMAPHGAAGISVAPAGEASSSAPFIGGTTVGEDGSARLEVEVPCDVAGSSDVEVAGPTVDGGRFRHVEPVELEGRCRAAWELTTREWSVVLATAVLAIAAVVATTLLRRRRRGRRRRSVREGSAGPRSRTRRRAGRRRSPRRRRHRLRR